MATSAAAGLLGRQLKQMQSDKDIPGISCGLVDNNVFEWEVMLMISDDCKFYGGRSSPRSRENTNLHPGCRFAPTLSRECQITAGGAETGESGWRQGFWLEG